MRRARRQGIVLRTMVNTFSTAEDAGVRKGNGGEASPGAKRHINVPANCGFAWDLSIPVLRDPLRPLRLITFLPLG